MENGHQIVENLKKRTRKAEKENKRLRAENEELRATLEYVAMMADVEIPTEEEEENE